MKNICILLPKYTLETTSCERKVPPKSLSSLPEDLLAPADAPPPPPPQPAERLQDTQLKVTKGHQCSGSHQVPAGVAAFLTGRQEMSPPGGERVSNARVPLSCRHRDERAPPSVQSAVYLKPQTHLASKS